MPAADARLADFVEWAQVNGVRAALLGDYRRIAAELLTLSSGGRVTESHILRLIDSYADRPGGRVTVTLIEEVGEAMLRHESARRLSLSSAPASPAPFPTPPPPALAVPPAPAPTPVATPPPLVRTMPPAPRRSAETFTARPSERISVELKPPSVQREPSVPPQLVSFTPTPDQPSAPVAPIAPTPPPPPVMQPPRARRRSGAQFRCLVCKTMVTADETGVCPRCGTAAPRISSSQVQAVTPPRNLRWVLPALLAVGAFALAFRFGPALVDKFRHPSEPVAGTQASTHLGVRHTFPEGWRHATDGDRAPASTANGFQAVIPEPVSLRSARFFRGVPGDVRAQLLLSVAPRPPGVTDEVFAGWAATAAAAPATMVQTVRELSGVSELRIERCVVGQTVPGGGMRCVGGANRTRALIYAWPARGVTAVAVFLSVESPEAALEEANDLVAGLDLS